MPIDSLLKSWKRSEVHNPKIQDAKDAMLQSFELKKLIEQKEKLLDYMHPTIENLASYLKSSESVVAISNTSGYLLKSIGDPKFLEKTEKIHVEKGACWSEEVRGTNSAGTISVEKRPLSVVGKEHYLESNHILYCVGSPIFDPSGNLQVVLNICGHSKQYHPAMLGMVDTIAQNIENWILIKEQYKQNIISLRSKKNDHGALIAVDSFGRITGSNRKARDLLPIITKNESIFLEDLFLNGQELLQSKKTINLYEKNNNQSELDASIILNSTSRNVSFSQQKTTPKESRPKLLKKTRPYYTFDDIKGEDHLLQETLLLAKKAANTEYPIVITGESGTGKEMISQAIHYASPRSNKPFIALNCGGITKSLAESEMFGYEAGAFTGAKNTGQQGTFERANGGTLFLDEIAELPLDIQVSLLRVLQDFRITRVGGNTYRQVDVRIITATNSNLWEKVLAGHFREDLFYRLQGININMPSLHKRSDRLNFAKNLLFEIQNELNKKYSINFSKNAEKLIENYSWPGNIRQLTSALREAAFSTTNDLIDIHNFPMYIQSNYHETKSTGSLLQDMENKLIKKTLNKTGNNVSKTAKILGIGRNTLYRKIENINKQKKQLN